MPDPIAEQIAQEIDRAITNPTGTLLGPDLAVQLRTRAAGRAPLLAAQLTGPDRHLAAQTATDLASLLPDRIPAQWWATPLGQAIARTHDPPQVVSMIEAAKILRVTRAAAYKAARSGHLKPAPGGVTLTSVLNRLTTRTTEKAS